jgi:predicted transcriptional regulator of viral defense system
MKNNMSHGEQEIYFSLEPGNIYEVRLIKNIVRLKKETLLILLSRLVKKGWLTRLKKGVYVVNFPDGKMLTDPFLTALNIFGGYLGFSSALYVYGVMDEYPSTVYVCTSKKSALRVYDKNIEIKAVALGKRATGAVYLKNYFVSSKGKTLYDCFYMPEHSGGYSNILAAIPRLKLSSYDWKVFLFYLKKFGNGSLSRKIGFMLEILNNSVNGAVPLGLLKELNVGKQITKLGRGDHGKFIKKWGIVNYIPKKDLLGKLTYG